MVKPLPLEESWFLKLTLRIYPLSSATDNAYIVAAKSSSHTICTYAQARISYVCRHPECALLGDFLPSLDALTSQPRATKFMALVFGPANGRRLSSVAFLLSDRSIGIASISLYCLWQCQSQSSAIISSLYVPLLAVPPRP